MAARLSDDREVISMCMLYVKTKYKLCDLENLLSSRCSLSLSLVRLVLGLRAMDTSLSFLVSCRTDDDRPRS